MDMSGVDVDEIVDIAGGTDVHFEDAQDAPEALVSGNRRGSMASATSDSSDGEVEYLVMEDVMDQVRSLSFQIILRLLLPQTFIPESHTQQANQAPSRYREDVLSQRDDEQRDKFSLIITSFSVLPQSFFRLCSSFWSRPTQQHVPRSGSDSPRSSNTSSSEASDEEEEYARADAEFGRFNPKSAALGSRTTPMVVPEGSDIVAQSAGLFSLSFTLF